MRPWSAGCHQNWPFLVRAYQPRHAQIPTSVTVAPSSKAAASPPSNASAVCTSVRKKRQSFMSAFWSLGAMLLVACEEGSATAMTTRQKPLKNIILYHTDSRAQMPAETMGDGSHDSWLDHWKRDTVK